MIRLKQLVSLGLLVFGLGFTLSATAQQERDLIEVLRTQIGKDRQAVVAANMTLSDTQAEKFWPLYTEYQGELENMNADLIDVIDNYAANYENLSDDQAKGLLESALANEEKRLKLKKAYVEKFGDFLPYKKVTRYFQIERKLWAIAVFDLSRKIPLVK